MHYYANTAVIARDGGRIKTTFANYWEKIIYQSLASITGNPYSMLVVILIGIFTAASIIMKKNGKK